MEWVKHKEKYLSESYFWKGKKEVECEYHYVYYDNGEIKYQIHSADRTMGENSGKWVCSYEQPIKIVRPYIEFFTGYMGLKNDEIVFCGGNGMFNAMGLPNIAMHDSVEEAKRVCEFHNQNPNKVRIYTRAESKIDCLKEK